DQKTNIGHVGLPSARGYNARPAGGKASGLRALVAADDDHVALGDRRADGERGLVFRRIPAVERGLIGGEFNDHVAGAAGALRVLEGAAAHDEAGAVFLEGRRVGRDVVLVALGVLHIHAHDPIALGHSFPLYFNAVRISATIACAAAFGSAAAITGRATTMWSAPARIASPGVITRFWSPAAEPAGRTPR